MRNSRAMQSDPTSVKTQAKTCSTPSQPHHLHQVVCFVAFHVESTIPETTSVSDSLLTDNQTVQRLSVYTLVFNCVGDNCLQAHALSMTAVNLPLTQHELRRNIHPKHIALLRRDLKKQLNSLESSLWNGWYDVASWCTHVCMLYLDF